MIDVSEKWSKRVLDQGRERLPRCRSCEPGLIRTDCECFNGFLVTKEKAELASPFLPGTPEKAAMISARLFYELPLWNPGDKQDRSHEWIAEPMIPTKRELLIVEQIDAMQAG